MTSRPIGFASVFGPDTAAHSAKNAHAASGLPNHHSGSDSERSPMVGTTAAPGVGQFQDIAGGAA